MVERKSDTKIYCCSRVIRPWLGLKMIELNKMIIAQLKERDPMFPDVEKGILVPTVSTHPSRRSIVVCIILVVSSFA